MRAPSRGPHFVIGGAPRSGTTWLYRALERHPDIFLARPVQPEPKFFLVDESYERGFEHYAQLWFAAAPPGRIRGEKSANYLESAVAAERMRRSLPDVKIVFLLRDPVERAISNWRWSRMHGFETEGFATAIALEPEREQRVPAELRYARPHAYVSRGLYADLLQPWIDLFGKAAILCLPFEDLAESPESLVGEVHRFLGVSERPGTAGGLAPVNASRGDIELDPATRGALAKRFEEPNRRLVRLLGPRFDRWPRPSSAGGSEKDRSRSVI